MNEQAGAVKRLAHRTWWRGIIGVVVAVAVAGWAVRTGGGVPGGNGAEARSAAAARPLWVSTLALEPENGFQIKRAFTGRVEPARSSALGFELAGMVGSMAVDEGDVIAAGQVLAHLDRARLEAREREAEAALASARARLALAHSTERRVRGLAAKDYASRQELDEARENQRALEAERAVARARLERVRVDLDKTRLRAPYDAVVVRRLVDEGRVLAAGTPVLEIEESAPPRARIGVERQLAGALTVGRRLTVATDAGPSEAVVRAVLPRREGVTRSVQVLLDLDGPAPRAGAAVLRSGDLVRLTLPRPVAAAGFWLPIGALTEGSRGTWSVYVTGTPESETSAAARRLERRSVTVLHQDVDRVFVAGALEAGERVVATGLHRLVPGQWVTIAKDGIRLAAGKGTP